MTIPYERTRAVLETRTFLQQLLDPAANPRVPGRVRESARSLLQHYPDYASIELAHKALPHLFGPVPPFSRIRGNPQTDALIDASTDTPGAGQQ